MEVLLLTDVWKFAYIRYGAQFVDLTLILMKQELSVDNWDMKLTMNRMSTIIIMHFMVKALAQCGLVSFLAKEMKEVCYSVKLDMILVVNLLSVLTHMTSA
jgi:hypothetical protein